MIKNEIGENAGKIWNALNELGEMNILELKNATQLDDKEIHLALGWLSREKKVLFWGEENDYQICLTEN